MEEEMKVESSYRCSKTSAPCYIGQINGGFKLLDEQGYRYVRNRVDGAKTYWSCERKKSQCKARAISNSNDLGVNFNGQKHNHSPQSAKITKPDTPDEPQEVCLRWNSYATNMQTSFPALLNSEKFADVTLACDGQSIKCHKLMLSACSDYLESILSTNPCQHPIIFMNDIKFWQLKLLIRFMYHGEINIQQNQLESLLAAAEILQIKGLASPSSEPKPDKPKKRKVNGMNDDNKVKKTKEVNEKYSQVEEIDMEDDPETLKYITDESFRVDADSTFDDDVTPVD